MSVCEPTAPSMSHFIVLSLSAPWHLLTPTIIMLIYVVWLHKVIYAQFYSAAAQGFVLLLLNVVKKNISPSSDSYSPPLLWICFPCSHPNPPTLSIKSELLWRFSRPTEKIIAAFTKWTTLICSQRDTDLRSRSSQSLLAPYQKWQNVCWVESRGQKMRSLPHLFTASEVIRNAEGC